MAMVPQHAFLLRHGTGGGDILTVNLFEQANATVMLGGKTVQVEQFLERPSNQARRVTLSFRSKSKAHFGIAWRMPAWIEEPVVRLSSGKVAKPERRDGWLILPAQRWADGDYVTLELITHTQLIIGDHGNQGLQAAKFGPLVLAYDESQNSSGEKISDIAFAKSGGGPLIRLMETRPSLIFHVMVTSMQNPKPHEAVFVPFADAGASGGAYKVWLPAPSQP
jgi:hypothetical protein